MNNEPSIKMCHPGEEGHQERINELKNLQEYFQINKIGTERAMNMMQSLIVYFFTKHATREDLQKLCDFMLSTYDLNKEYSK